MQPDYGPTSSRSTTTRRHVAGERARGQPVPGRGRERQLHYQRDLKVGVDIPASVADHLTDFHVVSHGIDTNHDGAYDFGKGPSDLDPSLPQEATVPASCGLIQR